ncbi:MAG: P-loop NTPase fold protein [Reichenbachiella sp.]|uniref:P-loop NTPase fold protein n=1 Tax=Reichenbachiella sp. TaxID=2184521 RepID=UPI003263517B
MGEPSNPNSQVFERFMEMNVFLANYVHASSNKLDSYISSESYHPQGLEGIQSEWNKVKLGDLLILKFIQVSNQLTIGAIGIVREKDDKGLTMEWNPMTKKFKIPSDEFYKRTFTELAGEQKAYVFDQLKSNAKFKGAVNVIYEKTKAFDEGKIDKAINLKHALSIDENDPILTQKGYHNQGPIGFIYSNKIEGSIPLTQVHLNSYKDYFYYLHRKNETFADNDISEEKIIGYVSTETKGGHIELMRYRKQENNDLDHFYCTQPNEIKIKEFNYKRERADFDYKYLLRDAGENLSKLYVYSNSPGIKLFSSAIITSPHQPNGVKLLIESNYVRDKSFWWIVNEQSKFDKVDRKISSGFGFTYIDKLSKQPDKGDVVIVVSKNRDYFIQGVFEVTNSAKNVVYAKYLYEFKVKTTVSQLHKSNSTNTNELTTRNGVYPISKELFQEIINTTELGSLIDIQKTETVSESTVEPNQKEVQKAIEARWSDSKFWWLKMTRNFWKDRISNLEAEFLLEEINTDNIPDSINTGDIVLTKYNRVKNVSGLFLYESYDSEGGLARFRKLYEFKTKPTIKELNEIDGFEPAYESFSPYKLYEVNTSLFAQIVNTTELNVELPPQPNDSRIPGQHSDVIGGDDYFDIDKDVTSFAKVIASSNFEPPIAIALFGKWGTGKSFFMEKLEKKIELLSKSGNTSYKSGFCHVRFNAWSYLDSNLWASIVSKIFKELNIYINNALGDSDKEVQIVRNTMNKELLLLNENYSKFRNKKAVAIKEKRRLERDAKRLDDDISKRKSEIKSTSIEGVLNTVNTEFKVQEKIITALENSPLGKEVWPEIKEIVPKRFLDKPTDLVNYLESYKSKIGLLFNKRNILILTGIFLITVSVPFLVDYISEYVSIIATNKVIIQFFGSITIFISGLAQRVKAIGSYLKPILSSIWKVKVDYELKIEEAKANYSIESNQINRELNDKSEELDHIESKLQLIQSEISDVNHKLDNSLLSESLSKFVSKSVDESKYSKHLGLVSMIREDFETLNSLFVGHEKERTKVQRIFDGKKQLDRIILYIDDLDRCSEDRVIEVLEAVNLLMAFPLFVVIVGVDPRWVKNALLKQYHTQFAGKVDGDNSGLEAIDASNYLEKIFQIPFHLNQASDIQVKNMLEKLSLKNKLIQTEKNEVPNIATDTDSALGHISPKSNVGNVDDSNLSILSEEEHKRLAENSLSNDTRTADDDHLKLTTEEINLIQLMSGILGSNPRAIKRFINVYHIILAHAGLGNRPNSTKDYLVIMFLLALPIGRYRKLYPFFESYMIKDNNEDKQLDQFIQQSFKLIKDTKLIKKYKSQGISIQNEISELQSSKNELDIYTTGGEFALLRQVKISDFKEQNKFIQRFTFSELA